MAGNTPHQSISARSTAGHPSRRGTAPSKMDQLVPHARDDVSRVGLDHPSTFVNRTCIPFIRRKEEDKVIGQLAAPGMASNEPSKRGLLLCDPVLIRRVY